MMLQLFYTRNIDELTNFIKQNIEVMPIKAHKRLIYNASKILNIYYNVLIKTMRIRGFVLYFKGKLGRKGSVKKSIIRIIRGKISLTNKSLRFNSKQFLIFTETGVIGCYMSIFY